jgi:L-ascorbate metabolism protein UlaG (beta-lactamase superfamily)
MLVHRTTRPRPKDPDPSVFTRVAPALVTPRAPATRLTLTWVGHASLLLQIDGLNILTDPMWSERASPVRFAGPRRWVAPGIAFEKLPPIDVVLQSHNHYDHLDDATVRRLTRAHPSASWIVPLGLAPFVTTRGARDVTDLAPAEPFAAQFADLDLTITTAGRDDPLDAVAPMLRNKVTVLLGHSGVGKSTLVNRLVPDADRATGEVTDIGRGRHTSTQSVALPLSLGGWVIDTPGIRSFGLAHIEPDDVLLAFSDLAEAIKDCPRGCGHMGPPADPECALDRLTGPAGGRVAAARRLLAALREG